MLMADHDLTSAPRRTRKWSRCGLLKIGSSWSGKYMNSVFVRNATAPLSAATLLAPVMSPCVRVRASRPKPVRIAAQASSTVGYWLGQDHVPSDRRQMRCLAAEPPLMLPTARVWYSSHQQKEPPVTSVPRAYRSRSSVGGTRHRELGDGTPRERVRFLATARLPQRRPVASQHQPVTRLPLAKQSQDSSHLALSLDRSAAVDQPGRTTSSNRLHQPAG